ncbi:MAG TPA: hypothetical protein VFT22_38515 [Kofleriaceae bacterium]|nr:hypothetical protein [Kofleriaceae bacterium]
MRAFTTFASFATCALVAGAAACTIPEKELTGSSNGDPLSCLNQPLPTKVKPQVTISGTVLDPFHGDIPSGASIEAFLTGNPSPVFTTTIGADGKFTATTGTGTVPQDFYMKTTPNGFLPSLYYPPVPLAGDLDATIFSFIPADLGPIAGLAGVTFDTTKAVFTVIVTDCNGMPLGGATVESVPAGDVRYFINSAPNPNAVSTDAMFGLALIANVPAVNVTIKAKYNGMELRSHTMDAQPGYFVMTGIQP